MRLQSVEIIEDPDKVNNLECPLIPAGDGRAPIIEPIPDIWTAAHVSRRLIDAYKTLAKTPKPKSPKEPGNSWGKYRYEATDIEAQAEIGEDELQERNEILARSLDRASGREIVQMEAVFEWLRAMRKRDSSLAYVVMITSAAIARRKSISKLCREKKLAIRTIERRRQEGLSVLADWLNSQETAVF